METILDLNKLNQFLKAEKFKMETPETIRTSLQPEWVTSIDFKDAYLPHTNTGTVQEIFKISYPESVHSSHGVHCESKGGETDGYTQGYNDTPVPKGLVGESQIPPSLSPAYSGTSQDLSETRLDGEL